MQVGTFQLHRLKQGPSRVDIEIKRKDLLCLYKDMLIVREIERQTKQLYQQQMIRGFCHDYRGQVGNTVYRRVCACMLNQNIK